MVRVKYTLVKDVAQHSTRISRARLSLEGLSIGDAFGECFFSSLALSGLEERTLPSAPWGWTDDTAMAVSIVETLERHFGIDRDHLARAFATRYAAEPRRGYGGTAHGILRAIGQGVAWREAAGAVFDGQGSMGNGSAMRVAPVGAYFADDLESVIEHARLSADPTHGHPDAKAGAIAVAVGAAFAVTRRDDSSLSDGRGWLAAIAEHVPASATRDGIDKSLSMPWEIDVRTAVAALGNGSLVICSDTVPLALWCAAHHLDDFEAAMWTTVSALGDRDTTCAMVGGIVAMSASIPAEWRSAREPLP